MCFLLVLEALKSSYNHSCAPADSFHTLLLFSPHQRTLVVGLGAYGDSGQSHLGTVNIIKTAKIFLPGKVTYSCSVTYVNMYMCVC